MENKWNDFLKIKENSGANPPTLEFTTTTPAQ
jgi:hypothetical protein